MKLQIAHSRLCDGNHRTQSADAVHGMGFGALYLLACSGAMVELYRRYKPDSLRPIEIEDERFLGATWL